MLDLTGFDMGFRPTTYWPEGFRPVELEKKQRTPRKMDPGENVFQASDGSFHWVTFPDEVVIVDIGSEDQLRLTARRDEDGTIVYRYVGVNPELFLWPPYARPLIERSREPLTFGEVVFSIDNTTMSDRLSPSSLNIAAYLWAADIDPLMTRTERMLNVNQIHLRSRTYPQLEKYYAMVGGHYVQTGELHEVSERPTAFTA